MKDKRYKGWFISLEGGEGAGKTTLLKPIATFLMEQGYQVLVTREPGGTSLGETIRHWLLHREAMVSIGREAELLLFLAARAQHIEEKILPALEAGHVVLCDRFNDSTIAYQGGARGLGVEYVQTLCDLICGSVVPQFTLFLDVLPQVGLVRSQKVQKEHAASGQLDRIESEAIDFHQKIQDVFHYLVKKEPSRFYPIDANQPQDRALEAAIVAMQNIIIQFS